MLLIVLEKLIFQLRRKLLLGMLSIKVKYMMALITLVVLSILMDCLNCQSFLDSQCKNFFVTSLVSFILKEPSIQVSPTNKAIGIVLIIK